MLALSRIHDSTWHLQHLVTYMTPNLCLFLHIWLMAFISVKNIYPKSEYFEQLINEKNNLLTALQDKTVPSGVAPCAQADASSLAASLPSPLVQNVHVWNTV